MRTTLDNMVREDFSQEVTVKLRGIHKCTYPEVSAWSLAWLQPSARSRERKYPKRANDEVETRVNLPSSGTRGASARREEGGIGCFIWSYHLCLAPTFTFC